MKQLLLLLGALLLLAPRARAHGGEDHGQAAAATSGAAPTSFSVAALSESFELLLRYEPLEAGQPAHLRLFVSDYATNVPIKGAQLTITSPEDASLKWTAEPQEPGEYLLEGQFPANKKYSFAVNIVAGPKADLLLLEGIEVGKKLPVAAVPATAAPGLFSSWKTLAALLGAFVLGVGLTFLLLRRRRPAAPVSTPAAPVYENHA
ncbi:hypothetical protein [Hymenobacter metallicola]|uniref:CopC domain-containing protein n=1 Tax=Hymenobacter metallicola TaxID=2563114 RepID=A0A4Z0QI22_9BACT|nr:hypothetical protein [Hymenobacter metallicola]TGE29355.1 hypothetical protein E5K02_07835 [Hymenobacter metallicola]